MASDWESTGRASPRTDFVPGDWDQSLSSSPLENDRGPGEISIGSGLSSSLVCRKGKIATSICEEKLSAHI